MSNILFKYGPPDDADEEPSDGSGPPSAAAEAAAKRPLPAEVKFIDFQSARFTSLATDLVYFIFTSVRVSTRGT